MRIGRLVVAALITVVGAMWAAPAGADSGPQARAVALRDDCDPASFNEAVGPGTCVGSGETTFNEFVAELQKDQVAKDWNMDPNHFNVKPAQAVAITNQGGELHSFTRVAMFGGGFIDFLNQLSGNPVPCAECAVKDSHGDLQPPPPSASNMYVGPGQTVMLDTSILTMGVNRFQCVIHPWMRTIVTLKKA
jgi:hypothetical protein